LTKRRDLESLRHQKKNRAGPPAGGGIVAFRLKLGRLGGIEKLRGVEEEEALKSSLEKRGTKDQTPISRLPGLVLIQSGMTG